MPAANTFHRPDPDGSDGHSHKSPTRQLAGAGTILLTISVLTASTAFLLNVLSSQILGPSGRGEIALALQLTYTLAPFAILGADRYLLRTAASHPWPTLLPSALLTIIIGVAAIPISLYFASAWWLLVGPILFVNINFARLRSWSLSNRRLHIYALSTTSYQIALVAGGTGLWFIGYRQSWAWLSLWAWPAPFVILYLLWKHRRDLTIRLPREIVFLMPGSLATIVLLRSERLLLPIIASLASLGIYTAYATAMEFCALPSTIASDYYSRAGSRPTRKLTLLLFLATAASAIFVATLLYLFAGALFGDAFAAERMIVVPMMLAAILLAGYRFIIGRILASRQPLKSSAVEIQSALLSIPAYVVGITLGGAQGAAWASAIAYLGGIVIAAKALRANN